MSCVVVPQSASGSGRTVITLSRRMAIVTVASEERGRKSGGKNSLVEEGRGIGMCRWGGCTTRVSTRGLTWCRTWLLLNYVYGSGQEARNSNHNWLRTKITFPHVDPNPMFRARVQSIVVRREEGQKLRPI